MPILPDSLGAVAAHSVVDMPCGYRVECSGNGAVHQASAALALGMGSRHGIEHMKTPCGCLHAATSSGQLQHRLVYQQCSQLTHDSCRLAGAAATAT